MGHCGEEGAGFIGIAVVDRPVTPSVVSCAAEASEGTGSVVALDLEELTGVPVFGHGDWRDV